MSTSHISYLIFVLVLFASCNFSRKIRDGETAYQQKQYARAVEMLQEEYERTRDEAYKGYRAFLIGSSYDKINQPGNAVPWYRRSYEHGYGVEALARYAADLKKNGQYETAIKAYNALLKEYGSSEEWQRALEGCRLAIKWKREAENSSYRIERAEFNSGASDYGPVFISESEILFSSDQGAGGEEEIYWWTGRNFSDIYLYNKAGGAAVPFDNAINSGANEGALAMGGEDLDELFFTRCSSADANTAYCKLYVSRKDGRFWTRPVELPFQEENANYTSPALLPGETGLVFASDKEGGEGGYDLYVSYRRGAEWTEVQSLSNRLNTPGDEAFPTVYGDTLYFSSNGLTGMGGFDIYRTLQQPDGSWAEPVNMKAPINSSADDCCFAVDPWFNKKEGIVQSGMFSSSRREGSSDDIYLFYKIGRDKEAVPEEPALPGEIIVEVQVLGKTYMVNGDPSSGLRAMVPLGNAQLSVSSPDTLLNPGLDANAEFQMKADPATDYVFLANRPGFLKNSYELRTAAKEELGTDGITYVVDLVLEPLIVGREIVLEDIYYDFDRWEIRDDAKPTLDELAKLLKLNPEIRIELGSHTDCRGMDSYNQELSQRRAQSAVDYLVSNGISRARLSAKGYGESNPAADCMCHLCTEAEHQRNRRTTFKILE